MEEISSSDSFHSYRSDGDNGNQANLQSGTEASSNLNKGKHKDTTATTSPQQSQSVDGDSGNKINNDEKDDVGDEEFEHISEGTFELDDENESMTAVETEVQSPSASNKPNDSTQREEEEDDDDDDDDENNEETAVTSQDRSGDDIDDEQLVSEIDKTIPLHELDVPHVAGQQEKPTSEDDGGDEDDDEENNEEFEHEKGETSIPSKQQNVESDSENAHQDDEMDVDPIQGDSLKADGGDRENASDSSDNENELNSEQKNDSNVTAEATSKHTADDAISDDVDKSLEKSMDMDDQISAAQGDEADNQDRIFEGEEKSGNQEREDSDGSQNTDDDDDDPDNENETVENVQEPLESDVCLIPDDTETEVTEAEKAQAILARQNAEKEDETNVRLDDTDEHQSDAVATEADETDTAVEEGATKSTEQSDEAVENTDAMEVDDVAPEPDEPLLEEMTRGDGDESGETAPMKTLIVWIISTLKRCVQCGEEKLCGFRYKSNGNSSSDSSVLEYLCEQSCCDAFMLEHPQKYFMRRKKFLVEEFSESGKKKQDKANDGNENSTTTTAMTESTALAESRATEHECLQCKDTKICKYFVRQDDEMFYLCTDACYGLLNVIEPDKFKLKRHSIRVRNIGATLTTPITSHKKSAAGDGPVVARTTAEAEVARLERAASFTRRCADCMSEINLGDRNLLWETIDFCNEICLGRYQRRIGSMCRTCDGEVSHQALGKYCVRFGFDIRQFCCAACLNDYKKGLKTCSCCQKDMSGGNEGFLAPVGDKEQFKDFCSQACMRRYDSMCNPKKKPRNDVCAVCNNEKAVRVEINLDGKEHTFCSNPCFSAFKFVSNVIADQCNMCCKYFERKGAESFTIYTGRHAKVFCSTICLNVYIIVNRRIVSCQWCKVKKYNFDMIYKQQDGQEILMCSLNCLTLYGVSINAFSRTMAKCDHCNTTATPQYHLTMSDASMRNFCTYQCVMQFQSQFARAPLTLDSEAQSSSTVANMQNKTASSSTSNDAPFPTGLPKRVKLRPVGQQTAETHKNSMANKKINAPSALPIISTVASLASGETETMVGNITVRRGRCRGRRVESPPPLTAIGTTTTTPAPAIQPTRGRPRKNQVNLTAMETLQGQQTQQLLTGKRGSVTNTSTSDARSLEPVTIVKSETKIITVPPYPAAVRNMQTSCKPQTVTQEIQTAISTCDMATQTSKDYSNKVLIPVPVPIYVPQPMYMYSAPFPIPVPIPLPIPVPIFIPTTRNTSQGILKEIKKIQDKMPTDPFEAELLMMAEMVAEERHESESESDSEIKPEPNIMSTTPSSATAAAMTYGTSSVVQPLDVTNNSYGEDVLQMAIKMATADYDTPSVDLESAMATNTIGSSPIGMGHDDSLSQMNSHQLQQQHQHMLETPTRGRGRKRGAIAAPVTPRNGRSPAKRQRMLPDLDHHVDTQPLQQQQNMMQVVTATTPMLTEKPDANMCLKYTFGVNAWKQWVMTKNADIEKSSARRRTFKTELLQMTADELNYSLCLFVKEVRKPNGTEYAPDTIYYLVLGIQQYLYENGRIDNIFTDPYYERFTECLDEVARKFSVLYNDSQYIVTRVEEEHLWECKQLGAHSPHVLLSTLMFFNTKHFNLTTVEEHMQLSFSHIMKHWKRSAQNAKTPGTRNVLLRFYPPQAGLDANPRKKKVYEQQENEENPLRCPVRLYEFYLSKCPESVKTRNDVFYLQPERSCVPDSPVWYSTQALSQDALQKMLHRVKMVKEINIALLTS